ncbi:hypothetical protein Hanom_Chr12g01166901 [Helianthus anomalus]
MASSASMLQWSFTGGRERCFAISLQIIHYISTLQSLHPLPITTKRRIIYYNVKLQHIWIQFT